MLGFAVPAVAANLVQNGSLEDTNATFSGTGCNYMTLNNGSTAISGWTVSTSSGSIAWAQAPTCDGYSASDATHFVDLSGLGSSSPDGALKQTLSPLGAVTYTFSMDVGTANNGGTTVTVSGNVIALSSGTPC